MKANNNLLNDGSQERESEKSRATESLISLKQNIYELKSLKNALINQVVVLNCDPNYVGQSWGGARAMVISADLETRQQYAPRRGRDAVLCTAHAAAIGALYQKLVKITAANYLAKFEMWGLATEAGEEAVRLDPSISQIDLAVVIVDEVIRVHGLWLARSLQEH